MVLRFVPVNRKHLKRLNQIVNDREVNRFLSPVPPIPMKSTQEWYRHNRKRNNCWWAIVSEGEVVGSVNLMRKATSGRMTHVVELGLAIDRPYWNMGFGKKAIAYAKKQARQKGFKRFELWAVKDNKRAIRLYRRCGFQQEGVMKGLMKIGRNYCDAVMMAMWLE